jgi:hypothetical protein
MIHPINGYDYRRKRPLIKGFSRPKTLKTFKIFKTAFYARAREGEERRRRFFEDQKMKIGLSGIQPSDDELRRLRRVLPFAR